jgi:O-methyltransferase
MTQPYYVEHKYQPWEDPTNDLSRIVIEARHHSLVTCDRLYVLAGLLRQALTNHGGQIIECGVYKGGSAKLILDVIRMTHQDRLFIMFDTFEGMPQIDQADNYHKMGDFADTSVEQVHNLLTGYNYNLIQGLFQERFKQFPDWCFSFAHIDVDLYQSTKECCEYIYPRMQRTGIMLFDDYGFDTCLGAKKAVDEFFADKGEKPIILPTGQAFVIRL